MSKTQRQTFQTIEIMAKRSFPVTVGFSVKTSARPFDLKLFCLNSRNNINIVIKGVQNSRANIVQFWKYQQKFFTGC